MAYIGDFRLGKTFDLKFTSVSGTFVPTTLAGSPVISAYPDNSLTQLTAGITLSVDFDGVTGLNNVRVVATSGNGYATATNYQLVITTGTVSAASVVGYVVGQFSIEARSALMPATADRTLVVDASGLADATTVKLGPTGAGTAQTARDIGTSVLLSTGTGTGQLDFTSGVVKADAVKINAVSTSSVTTVSANVGTTQPINFTGTAGSALAKSDMVDIAGAAVSTSSAQLGVNVVNVAGSASTGSAGYVGVDWGQVANKTTSNALTGTTISTSQVVASVTAGVTLAAGAIQAVWDALTSALTTAGSIGKLLVDNVNATISSRMATYTQPSGFLAATFPTTVASPTNITAGTITTVTNLTNAATAGDFTATMKTSIGTAVAASAVASVTGNVGGNVTGSVGSVATGGITAASIASNAITSAKIATDAIGAAQLAADAVDEIWDEVMEGSTSARQSLRLANSANGGILSGAATTTVDIRDLADTKNRVVATVDANGNRSAVTLDLS